MRSGLTRGNGISLIVAGLVAALSVTLTGCGGSDQLTSIKRTLENPFRKDEAKLPGERIAVITDPNMTSGPIVLQVLEGENAIARNREVMGATNPVDAAPGSIRKDFAVNLQRNSVHGSDSPETAKREIALCFKKTEIVG